MNKIVLSQRASALMPTISRELEAAIERSQPSYFGPRETPTQREARLRRGDPCPSMVIQPAPNFSLNPEMRKEAEKAIIDLERALSPLPSHQLVEAASDLIDVINASVANPQPNDSLKLRRAVFASALEETPSCSLTKAATIKVVKHFKFFPSVAELTDFLEDLAEPAREKLSTLRLLISKSEQPKKPQEPSRVGMRDARFAVAAALANFRAEAEARAERAETEHRYLFKKAPQPL